MDESVIVTLHFTPEFLPQTSFSISNHFKASAAKLQQVRQCFNNPPSPTLSDTRSVNQTSTQQKKNLPAKHFEQRFMVLLDLLERSDRENKWDDHIHVINIDLCKECKKKKKKTKTECQCLLLVELHTARVTRCFHQSWLPGLDSISHLGSGERKSR